MRGDELGISAITTARPVQAADIGSDVFRGSGDAIADGRGVSRERACPDCVSGLIGLSRLAKSLRAIGAKAGVAKILRATLHVTFWRALALGSTAETGKLFGAIV